MKVEKTILPVAIHCLVEDDFRLANIERYWLELSSYDLEKVLRLSKRIRESNAAKFYLIKEQLQAILG